MSKRKRSTAQIDLNGFNCPIVGEVKRRKVELPDPLGPLQALLPELRLLIWDYLGLHAAWRLSATCKKMRVELADYTQGIPTSLRKRHSIYPRVWVGFVEILHRLGMTGWTGFRALLIGTRETPRHLVCSIRANLQNQATLSVPPFVYGMLEMNLPYNGRAPYVVETSTVLLGARGPSLWTGRTWVRDLLAPAGPHAQLMTWFKAVAEAREKRRLETAALRHADLHLTDPL